MQLALVMRAKQVNPKLRLDWSSTSLMIASDPKLMAREKEILSMLANGKRTPDIADQVYISPATVNNHVQHIMEKLDSHSRLEVVVRAREAGII